MTGNTTWLRRRSNFILWGVTSPSSIRPRLQDKTWKWVASHCDHRQRLSSIQRVNCTPWFATDSCDYRVDDTKIVSTFNLVAGTHHLLDLGVDGTFSLDDSSNNLTLLSFDITSALPTEIDMLDKMLELSRINRKSTRKKEGERRWSNQQATARQLCTETACTSQQPPHWFNRLELSEEGDE